MVEQLLTGGLGGQDRRCSCSPSTSVRPGGRDRPDEVDARRRLTATHDPRLGSVHARAAGPPARDREPARPRRRPRVGRPLTGYGSRTSTSRHTRPGCSERTDVEGLVVLGGRLSPALDAHLRAHRALIFPTDPHAPVNPYRAALSRPASSTPGSPTTATRHARCPRLPLVQRRRAAPRRLRDAAARDPRRLDGRRPRRVRRAGAGRGGHGRARPGAGHERVRRRGAARPRPRRCGARRGHRWRARCDGGSQPRRVRPASSGAGRGGCEQLGPGTVVPPAIAAGPRGPRGARRPALLAAARGPASASRPGSTDTSRRTSSATASASTSPTPSARTACSHAPTAGLVVLEGAAGTVQEIFQA